MGGDLYWDPVPSKFIGPDGKPLGKWVAMSNLLVIAHGDDREEVTREVGKVKTEGVLIIATAKYGTDDPDYTSPENIDKCVRILDESEVKKGLRSCLQPFSYTPKEKWVAIGNSALLAYGDDREDVVLNAKKKSNYFVVIQLGTDARNDPELEEEVLEMLCHNSDVDSLYVIWSIIVKRTHGTVGYTPPTPLQGRSWFVHKTGSPAQFEKDMTWLRKHLPGHGFLTFGVSPNTVKIMENKE